MEFHQNAATSLPNNSLIAEHLVGSVLALAGFLLLASPLPCQAQGGPANVVVAPVIQSNVLEGSTFVATVRPARSAVIGSAVDGRVFERHVEEGDRVEAGKPLIQLLTNTIEIELRAAEAELNLRKEELRELENGSRPAEVEQARAKMKAAEADTIYARSQLDRLQRLKGASAISQGDLDQAKAEFDQKTQTYRDLSEAYDLAVEGPRAEKIAQARAVVAMQEARVDQIRDRINKYTIMSRFDGYVVQQMVETGAWVKTGDPIVEVIELDEVELEAFVPERHVTFIRPGAEVRVELPAMPGKVFTGKLKAVIPSGDSQSRTFPVIVRVKNEIEDGFPLIKSGLSARVDLPIGKSLTAMLVPKDAIVLGGQQPAVYVVAEQEGKTVATPVPVQLGVAQGELIQVTGQLKPGQRVVVEGNERLRPGQELIIAREVTAKELSANEPGSNELQK